MKKKIMLSVASFALLSGGLSAQACTSVLVGKDASVDGSTIISRNEDMGNAWPKYFIVRQANSNPTHYVSKANGFTIDLPKEQAKYTATPEWDTSEGLFEEAGTNDYNVAMSATESATTKEDVLKKDPLVEDGVGEDSVLTVVLPYVKTAKEGVERLGKIVDDQGSAEPNGIIFSDKDSIWYMELYTGHHWAAVRVPDDKYAVIPNRFVIESIDTTDTDNYLASPGLEKFIKDNALAKDMKDAKMYEVFGDATDDAQYNNPRIWDGQNILSPSLMKDKKITDSDFELFQKPDEKITIPKVAYVLRSHFNNTKYDTYTGSEADKYRPINVPKTMESHIIQFRPDVPNEISGVHWLALGVPDTSSYVPFYTGITQTPANYQKGTDIPDFESAYWTYRTTNALTVPYYAEYKNKEILPVRKEVRKQLFDNLRQSDEQATQIIKEDPNKLVDYLNSEGQKNADYTQEAYKKLNQQLIINTTQQSPVKHKSNL